MAPPPDGDETGSMAGGEAHGTDDEEDVADDSSNTTDKEDSAEEAEAELAVHQTKSKVAVSTRSCRAAAFGSDPHEVASIEALDETPSTRRAGTASSG